MKSLISVVLIFSLIFNVHCDLASEQVAYAVEVIFYRLTTDTWTANAMETTFAGVMASAANSYCESVSGNCGLTSCCTSVSISFKETDVGKVSGYPQKDLKNLKHKFYLQFPTGFTASNSSVTQYVVVNSALYEIIRLGRTTFHTQTGYWITWADETYYGIPATTLENQIIIPIAFVVLFLVIFLAIGLHFWNKKKQNEARLKKKIDNKKAMKKNQAMVQPTYRVDPEIKDIDEETTEKTKEKMYADSYPIKQSNETSKKHMGGASDTDSAIKMENEHMQEDMDFMDSKNAVKGNLPPLDNQEDGEKKKKKKKKEKKKKHHDEGYDNQSANLSTEL
ncbi:uncharacterized protein LOC111125484 isoform X4 [Crassostrea virginica]|uniref:Uncharacterized protein LOC111125484 isoform X4 n=1 Tax=Crassostrea virginica TaxID=6565 RepID=A0A8B8DBT0_CRAVI|nr:uncharacterized protein LOC111125484 isoform X4 [Crassostrea virginica]